MSNTNDKLSDRGFVTYRNFRIYRKLDFGAHGHIINGEVVRTGYIISDSDGICNVMPGATWAQTLEQAVQMIDHYILADGNADVFWRLVHDAKQAAA